MRKRMFFVIDQLNIVRSAELFAMSLSSAVASYYDVFVYSIQEIDEGKVHPLFNVNPRIMIRSLSAPKDEEERNKFFVDNKAKIEEELKVSIRPKDIFVVFSKDCHEFLPSDCYKIFVAGFAKPVSYDNFDALMFLSSKEKEENIKLHPEIADKAYYVPPFARFTCKEDYKFHGNHLLCVTRFDEQRNPFFALEVAKRLKDEGIKFHLTLCGEGTVLPSLEEKIWEYQLDTCVEINNFEKLHRLFEESDLLIFNIEEDSIPLMVVESMISSVPVISTIKNVYTEEFMMGTGVFVDDVDSASSRIIAILKDKIKLSKMKYDTFDASHRFTQEASLKQFDKMLESVIENED